MKTQFSLAIVVIALGFANAYSKYGRSCKDIGCLTNEVCIMAEDPCRRRDEPCGSYPTCQKVSNEARSCANFVCPPTTVCRMDRDTPKCVNDNGASGNNADPYANIDVHNTNNNNNNGNGAPSAPLYPQIPARGQTTTRPPIYRPNNGGGGYQGGTIGSGYPGQAPSNYPGYPGYQQPNNQGQGYPGYPGYSGYPSQGQNGYSGYPGYPSQGQNGYSNSGGYSGKYPNYPSNQGGYQNPYSKPANSDSNPLYDKFKDTLKNIGLFSIILLQNFLYAH